ncbi:MAG: triose-phosphate isomerase [bacterium]
MKVVTYADILSASRKDKKVFTGGKYIITPLAKEAQVRHGVKILAGGKSMRREIIAGNWKMNKTAEEAESLARGIADGVASRGGISVKNRIVVLCPPFTALAAVREIIAGKDGVFLGAQNVYYEDKGAFTGEVSAEMLSASGCSFVIVGHSERRKYFGDTDEIINLKVKKALGKKLTPILCVGETLEEREAHRELKVVKSQLKSDLDGMGKDTGKIVIAYEPVWAIGTGKTATPETAQKMHEFIRKEIAEITCSETAEKMSILYGGSVNPENVKQLMECPDIDGGLIGGASLKAADFLKLVYYDG